MAAALVSLLFASSGRADNGTASYFDFNNTTAGFGSPSGTINYSGSFWSTSSAGTVATTILPETSPQLTFGSIGSDLAGTTFNLNLDNDNGFTGILINSSSANITISGGGNTGSSSFGDGNMSWSVASGSILNMNANYGATGGINNYGHPLTLQGGGIINFGGVIGMNGSTNITQNMAGGTVNLQQTSAGGAPYSGGYSLTSGTLNFNGVGAAATAFSSMGNTKTFSINGGTIGNTSGSAATMSIGSGTYSIGGDFAFAGSSNLNLGTAAVALGSSVRQLTVSANTLTIGGVMSGTSGGITKLGAGTLTLSGANTYTGATTVSAGTLDLSGAAGALTTTSEVNINGGTLLLSGSEANRINNAATISLGAAGSTLQLSGAVTETLGAMTLAGGAGARVIDFGSGSGALTFASLTADSSLPLQIWNWSGNTVTGGGTDQLFITNGFAPSNVSFFNGPGTGLYSQATGFTSGGELVPGGLVPVPEASTLLAVLGLMAPLAWRERRHWMRCREARGN
jgi:autotransporter-associated beta strand protein